MWSPLTYQEEVNGRLRKSTDSLNKVTAAPKKAEPVAKTVVLPGEADLAVTHRGTSFQLCGHWLKSKRATGETPIAYLPDP